MIQAHPPNQNIEEPVLTYDSLIHLLKKKGYFGEAGLARFEKLCFKTQPVDAEITQQSIEVALVAWLLSIRADEARGKSIRHS